MVPVSTHLIVDYHMYGSVGCVRGQVGQVECLVHDALSCKCSVPMNQDRHHL